MNVPVNFEDILCLRGESQVREKIFIIREKFMKISEYLGTLMLIYLKKIYISYDPQKAKYMTICGQKL